MSQAHAAPLVVKRTTEHDPVRRVEEFLDAAYWIVLGRPLDDEWRRVRLRHLELGQSRDSVLHALFGSSEFRQRYHGYHDVTDPDVVVPGEEDLEAGLHALGTPRA